MIDKLELTEEEKFEFKRIALEKKKEQLEKELEDMKYKSMGLSNGKKSIELMNQYFKD